VQLSTAPDPTGATHWGQQTFSLHPAVDCAPGDALQGSIKIVRKKENHRLMEVRRA
jgi:protein arginine N-methyltransferase 1